MTGRSGPARATGRLGLALASAALAGGVAADPATAHPLGNFTVNQGVELQFAADGVEVVLLIDMAEIPTFQARREIDADGNGEVAPPEAGRYARRRCGQAAQDLTLASGGRRLALVTGGSDVAFPPGQAGLPTLRLECRFRAAAAVGSGPRVFEVRNDHLADRVGWREVTAVARDVTLLASDVPAASPSERLTRYPEDLLQSPIDRRTGRVEVGPGTGPAVTVAGRQGAAAQDPASGLAARYRALVARQDFGAPFALAAVALGLVLGAAHALAPGHGKTVMAAFLVGQRGSRRQAAVIGLTVTATHTLGVLLLGLAVSLSTNLAPESVYPWLGLTAGGLLAGAGMGLWRRARGRRPVRQPPGARHRADHPLPPETAHAHAHGHAHGPGHTPHHRSEPVAGHSPPPSRRALMALGVAGGLMPSPSALIVLLGAVAVGRPWFGVLLVVAYGLGMAATLTGIGLALARGSRALERRLTAATTAWPARLAAALPAAAAAFVTLAGLVLIARNLALV